MEFEKRSRTDHGRLFIFSKCVIRGELLMYLTTSLPQLLLETSPPLSWFRKHYLVALYKLCKASLVYPQCYPLKDITIGSREAGGAFSEVYKGQHGEQQLCLKVIRLCRKSEIEAMLKVCP